MELDRELTNLRHMAEARGAVLYEILFRNAGVGLVWWEEARCKTPLEPVPDSPSPEALPQFMSAYRRHSDSRAVRLREGLVVYQYYPTLAEAIRMEGARLLTVERVPIEDR